MDQISNLIGEEIRRGREGARVDIGPRHLAEENYQKFIARAQDLQANLRYIEAGRAAERALEVAIRRALGKDHEERAAGLAVQMYESLGDSFLSKTAILRVSERAGIEEAKIRKLQRRIGESKLVFTNTEQLRTEDLRITTANQTD
jgi:hypothetical protein